VDRREGIVRAVDRLTGAETGVGIGAAIVEIVATVAGPIAGASKVRRRSSWIS